MEIYDAKKLQTGLGNPSLAKRLKAQICVFSLRGWYIKTIERSTHLKHPSLPGTFSPSGMLNGIDEFRTKERR
jgi:hypothetical protein